MNLNSINDLFVEELKDLYSAEQQLSDILPQWVQAAHNHELKQALKDEQRDVQQQIKKLGEVFKVVHQPAEPQFCQGMKGLIDESRKFLNVDGQPEVKDNGLIANIQRCKHYEIAVYGTLCAFGNYLDLQAAPQILHEILEQEKAEDLKFTEIAQRISQPVSKGGGNGGMVSIGAGTAEAQRSGKSRNSWEDTQDEDEMEGTLEMGAQLRSTMEELGDAEDDLDIEVERSVTAAESEGMVPTRNKHEGMDKRKGPRAARDNAKTQMTQSRRGSSPPSGKAQGTAGRAKSRRHRGK